MMEEHEKKEFPRILSIIKHVTLKLEVFNEELNRITIEFQEIRNKLQEVKENEGIE